MTGLTSDCVRVERTSPPSPCVGELQRSLVLRVVLIVRWRKYLDTFQVLTFDTSKPSSVFDYVQRLTSLAAKSELDPVQP